MEIKQLEIFCAVVEKKGFSAAAEVLNMAQPTVSFQIASLEEELGTRLLDRSGRITILTKSGEILYRYAIQILGLASEARQALHQLNGLLWGEIAMGASTIPGEYILPGILQRFRTAHPGIAIDMSIGDTRTIIKRVIDAELEIGIVGASEKNEKLAFTRFVKDQLVLIAPAGNNWFKGNPVSPDELIGVPFILREEGSGTRKIMEQKLGERGISPGSFNLVMSLGSTEAVKHAVEEGAGVSIVSEKAVQNEIKLGLLEVIDISGIELARDFFIVHRKNKILSPAVEALSQFLVE